MLFIRHPCHCRASAVCTDTSLHFRDMGRRKVTSFLGRFWTWRLSHVLVHAAAAHSISPLGICRHFEICVLCILKLFASLLCYAFAFHPFHAPGSCTRNTIPSSYLFQGRRYAIHHYLSSCWRRPSLLRSFLLLCLFIRAHYARTHARE